MDFHLLRRISGGGLTAVLPAGTVISIYYQPTQDVFYDVSPTYSTVLDGIAASKLTPRAAYPDSAGDPTVYTLWELTLLSDATSTRSLQGDWTSSPDARVSMPDGVDVHSVRGFADIPGLGVVGQDVNSGTFSRVGQPAVVGGRCVQTTLTYELLAY